MFLSDPDAGRRGSDRRWSPWTLTVALPCLAAAAVAAVTAAVTLRGTPSEWLRLLAHGAWLLSTVGATFIGLRDRSGTSSPWHAALAHGAAGFLIYFAAGTVSLAAVELLTSR